MSIAVKEQSSEIKTVLIWIVPQWEVIGIPDNLSEFPVEI